ncbi:MAG: hypothetical protein Q9201_007922, partial [Fulgogasparrea decipioides]
MPLHLLGKKSWNVYNQENILRVKRNEAAAAAREAAEEQRMQEVDAERRIQLFRGLKSPPAAASPAVEPAASPAIEQSTDHALISSRKRRRIAGEDDTDRDIRFAKEDQALALPNTEVQVKPNKSSDAPLTDSRGYISLFPSSGPDTKHHHPKHPEVEAEKARKKKEYEDQYTMRFSNAAGFKQSVGEKPWYQSLSGARMEEGNGEVSSKDVWGNEDPRRKERERARVAKEDPMAAMQQGVAQLRDVERERKRWQEDREREIEELAEVERRRRRRKSKRKHEEDGLEEFSLDAPADDKHSSRYRHRHRHRHR